MNPQNGNTSMTKWWLIPLLIIVSAPKTCHAHCDQKLFDELYEEIIRRALNQRYERRAFDEKNDSIRFLRKLCRGQYSSYERDLNSPTTPLDKKGRRGKIQGIQ